jgi:hypothetical protein
MNPVAFELLNRAEKQRRSKEIEGLQLLNEAEATRPSRPNLFLGLVSRLGRLLMDAGQWLEDVAGLAGLPVESSEERIVG